MERILIADGGKTVCQIAVGDGVLPNEAFPTEKTPQRVAIVTQPTPIRQAEQLADHLRDSGAAVSVRVLPDREDSKTLAVAEETFIWLNSQGMTRSDALIAVGGGALTDVGGFIGGTYLRGIETVLVPTTLLAAVDAAIGGKSAVNVGGKNLVGLFRHPARVVVDTAILRTLPDDIVIEGTAEVLKAGLIADASIVDLYEAHGLSAPLDELVNKAIRVKAEVVSTDFTEQGRRAVLNYGHTVGHAVETTSGISHGHAVAIGMVAAAAVAETVTGFTGANRQTELIASLQLPTVAPPVDTESVWAALGLDKKRDDSGMRMVLLEDIGRPTVVTVDPTTVRAALSAVGIE